jgi:hypothetical protein
MKKAGHPIIPLEMGHVFNILSYLKEFHLLAVIKLKS